MYRFLLHKGWLKRARAVSGTVGLARNVIDKHLKKWLNWKRETQRVLFFYRVRLITVKRLLRYSRSHLHIRGVTIVKTATRSRIKLGNAKISLYATLKSPWESCRVSAWGNPPIYQKQQNWPRLSFLEEALSLRRGFHSKVRNMTNSVATLREDE